MEAMTERQRAYFHLVRACLPSRALWKRKMRVALHPVPLPYWTFPLALA